MPWGVFFRPSQHPEWDQNVAHSEQSFTFVREYTHHPHHHSPARHTLSGLQRSTTPRFRTPLSDSLLNDPAFSSDPRSHPHFPITDASSFKQLPAKSPRNLPHPLHRSSPPDVEPPSAVSQPHRERSPSPASASLESKSSPVLSAFTSSTVSSATSHSHTLSHERRTPSPVALSTSRPSSSPTELHLEHGLNPPSPPLQPLDAVNFSATTHEDPVPEVRQNFEMPPAPSLLDRKKHAVGRRRMKNFVLRFTKRPDLDRIDELDETDPFGGGFHHVGPYEAIASNLSQLGPYMYRDIDVSRGDLCDSKRQVEVVHAHDSESRLVEPVKTTTPLGHVKDQSHTRERSPVEVEGGLPLNHILGQIPRRKMVHEVAVHNALPNMTPSPNLFRRKPATSITRPHHARSQSLPNHPTNSCEVRSPSDSQGCSPISLEGRPSPSAPRVHYFGDNIPNLPNSAASKIDGNPAAYPRHCRHAAPVLRPTRHESTSRSPSLPQPSDVITAQTQPMSAAGIDLEVDGPRHRNVRSLDNTPSHKAGSIRALSSSQGGTLAAPRIHHRPKRLVMPTPLQPQAAAQEQASPPHYTFPQAVDYEDYQDHQTVGNGQAGETPALYNPGRKVLRKKSSAFPANIPLPVHAPMTRADTAPVIRGSSRSNLVHEAERIMEGPRRRKLSKRKNDGQ